MRRWSRSWSTSGWPLGGWAARKYFTWSWSRSGTSRGAPWCYGGSFINWSRGVGSRDAIISTARTQLPSETAWHGFIGVSLEAHRVDSFAVFISVAVALTEGKICAVGADVTNILCCVLALELPFFCLLSQLICCRLTTYQQSQQGQNDVSVVSKGSHRRAS